MRQRMRNYVPIDVPDIDLNSVTDIEVTFKQKSSDVELTYSGESIEIVTEHQLVVAVPLEDALKLDNKQMQGQVMFTRDSGVPDATEIFTFTVAELLKEEGYGD